MVSSARSEFTLSLTNKVSADALLCPLSFPFPFLHGEDSVCEFYTRLSGDISRVMSFVAIRGDSDQVASEDLFWRRWKRGWRAFCKVELEGGGDPKINGSSNFMDETTREGYAMQLPRR